MVLMKCIKSIGCILLLLSNSPLTASYRPTNNVVASHENKNDGFFRAALQCFSGSRTRSLVCIGAAVCATSWGAYHASDTVRDAFDSSGEKLRNFVKLSVAPLIVMKVEKIRDEGLNGEDIAKIGCFVGTCYAAKKLVDFFHLKELLYGNSSLTREALERCKKSYKKILLGVGVTSALGYGVWHLRQEPHVFDKLELDSEQRDHCSRSTELSALVREKDYSSLLVHEALMSLLNEKQQALCHALIEEYGEEYGNEYSLHLLDEMD
ncbi:hypothetical protein H0W26_05600 [Candidatus Dependentiae bacterium]|nr:hypothetical protein [Candidatus Dependentiae bacterium]